MSDEDDGRFSVSSDVDDEHLGLEVSQKITADQIDEEKDELSKKERVDCLIAECENQGNASLDLCRLRIHHLPEEILKLSHLEYLYLEGNQLSNLPEDFFGCFTNLKWLDLRQNRLKSIPSFYLKEMTNLRTLLLEGNELNSLPLELGFVQSLDGLNIRGNPLVFPPSEVIEKGVETILAFLQAMYTAKSGGNSSPDMKELIDELCGGVVSLNEETRQRRSQSSSSTSIRPINGADSNERETFGTNSATVSKPGRSAGRIRSKENRSQRKSTKPAVKTQSEKYLDPEAERPVTDEKVASKYLEEKQLAKLKNSKIKQNEIIQSWKDQEAVKNWRDEAKTLQQKKNMEKRIKGKLDYDEAVTKAPFGISNEDLKILTNEERLARDPQIKPVISKPMLPEEVLRLEKAKREQEHLLVAKIKEHTRAMLERRLHPLENPQMEMEAALRDFEIAEKLQQEIEIRRKELDYGFSAHTAEVARLKTHSDNKKH